MPPAYFLFFFQRIFINKVLGHVDIFTSLIVSQQHIGPTGEKKKLLPPIFTALIYV